MYSLFLFLKYLKMKFQVESKDTTSLFSLSIKIFHEKYWKIFTMYSIHRYRDICANFCENIYDTLMCLTASSGGRLATLSICVSTQALTAALESLYCCHNLHACWYLVQRASNSALVSSQACTASFTAASTFSRTSAAQPSRRGSAASRNSPMRTSRAPKSPLRPCNR